MFVDILVVVIVHDVEYTSFKHLGSVLNDKGSKPEILSRIAQTTAALTRLKPVWIDRSISLSSKIRLVRSLVTSICLYACQSWTLTAELQRRIHAMENLDLPCFPWNRFLSEHFGLMFCSDVLYEQPKLVAGKGLKESIVNSLDSQTRGLNFCISYGTAPRGGWRQAANNRISHLRLSV